MQSTNDFDESQHLCMLQMPRSKRMLHVMWHCAGLDIALKFYKRPSKESRCRVTPGRRMQKYVTSYLNRVVQA